MGYLVVPFTIIIIGIYILYLVKKKNKTNTIDDLSRLKDIEDKIDTVVTEGALNDLLSIISTINNNHPNDEKYIIQIDIVKSKIEKRRVEIAKKYTDSVMGDTSKN